MRLASCTFMILAVLPVVAAASDSSVNKEEIYVGSTPCDPPLKQLLGIPEEAKAELLEWRLTLTPALRFDLHVNYGLTAPNVPGLAKEIKRIDRRGTWKASDSKAIELDGVAPIRLRRISPGILHVLHPDDRSLLAGNGGWSYTLSRQDLAEPKVDRTLTLSQPSISYTISPAATGPTVYGVFEGRTPCQGIARELKLQVDQGCAKLKWRVTLLRNHTYKIEGSLFRRGAREGTWSQETNGMLKLAPDLTLYQASNDVLFFMNGKKEPMVGNDQFAYTIDRRRPK